MADIIWTKNQEIHITASPPTGHGISYEEFRSAWHSDDRVDKEQPDLETGGRQFRSTATTSNGRVIIMVWRWFDEELHDMGVDIVLPITAFD